MILFWQNTFYISSLPYNHQMSRHMFSIRHDVGKSRLELNDMASSLRCARISKQLYALLHLAVRELNDR